MSIEITTATASQRTGIRGSLDVLPDGAPAAIRSVFTQAEFLAALAEAGDLVIRLCANIVLPSGTTTIGFGKGIEFAGFKLIKGSGSLLLFLGECLASRRQIFSGFAAGEIRGTFGRADVYPEWWGLSARTYGTYPSSTIIDYSTPSNAAVLRDDIAINCAIQSFTPYAGAISPRVGIRVSLAAGAYYVARPLDLSGTMSSLVGAGSGRTEIFATTNWAPTVWLHAEQWPEVSGGNHAAMIWLGGTYTPTATAHAAATYRTQIRGLDLHCGAATYANWTRNVSGISAQGGVEECSVIDDILITSPSGFGIGFCRHRAATTIIPAGTPYPKPATVNGLTISNFWMFGPTKRTMVGIYLSKWSYDCKIMVGTVAFALAKSSSSNYATGGTAGGADTAVYTKDPRVNGDFLTYPLCAMIVAGCVSVENVHIEGTTIGVLVRESDGGPSTVSIRNIDVIHMMDRARGAVYYADGRTGADVAGTVADYHGYSCAVLIAGYGETDPETGITFSYQGANWRDTVALNSIHVQGDCLFLLRDDAYGQHIKSYGTRQDPTANGGAIASYSRGNIYARQTTAPYASIGTGFYDPVLPGSAASTSRTFFIGPIY
jgi:hypothetical protein